MSFEGQLNTTLGDMPVAVQYEGVYEPARISGPPEDCYPDGSELYVLSVTTDDGHDLFDFLSADTIASLEEKCWEDFHSGKGNE